MQTATKIFETVQNIAIKGRQFVQVFDMRSNRAMELEREIQEHIRRPWGKDHFVEYSKMVAELARLFKVREYLTENLIVTAGRSVVAARLANDTAFTGIINYGTLGTGTTAVSNGQTQLVTEVFRKIVASASDTNNIAFIDFFYSKTDTNGTYQEFGTVIDGTATANTGQMFTRVLTGGWVKTSSESMTVACQYTVN